MLLTASGTLAEFLAVRYAIYWLAVGAGVFFWLAFYEYTKAYLSKRSSGFRNAARICSAVLLAVATIALVHGPNLHTLPISDLRIVRESTLPFEAGERPKLNIWMMNDSPYTMVVRRFTATVILNGASSREVEKKAESTAWDALRDKFERIQQKVSPGFYPIQLPPKIETAMTLNEESPTESIGNGLLTPDQAKVLQNKGGSVVVIFMSIFAYSDDSGFHELEYCTLTQGGPILRCLTGHNGPVRSSRARWWN